jgi:hypothetical protein
MYTLKSHPLGCTIENMSVSLTSLKLTQSSHECGKPVLSEANRFTVLAAVVHGQHASMTDFM